MQRNSRGARTALALSLLTISLAGCATGNAPLSRSLPPESSVVLDPAPRAGIGVGDDARVAWKKEEARANDNESRLKKSRVIYRGVRKSYGGK